MDDIIFMPHNLSRASDNKAKRNENLSFEDDELRNFLEAIKLPQYYESFKKANITNNDELRKLKEPVLVDICKKKILHRIRIMRSIRNL